MKVCCVSTSSTNSSILTPNTHTEILCMLTGVFFFLYNTRWEETPKVEPEFALSFVQTAPSHAFLMRTLACYVSRLEQLSEYFMDLVLYVQLLSLKVIHCTAHCDILGA